MKTIKALVGLAILAFAAMASWAFLPPYFANYQFKDDMQTESRFSALGNKTEDAIRDTIYKKALEHDIVIKPEQIKVLRNGSDVSISVDYNVEVSIPTGQKFVLHFANSTDKNPKVF